MKEKKYLILGEGYMGKAFHSSLKNSVLSKIRINNQRDVEEEIVRHNPDVVINCIGKTGHPNVDWCEDHKEETINSNIAIPFYIALSCMKLNKRMVHLGSGCIYEGDNNGAGFSEEDKPNYYGSFYSISKIISQNILKEFNNVLQIRIRMPVSSDNSPRNLITKLLSYKRIINVPNSISVIEDSISIVRKLVDLDKTGIFNVVNKGAITHKEILDIAEEIIHRKLDYELISLKELAQITKTGRSNCILSTNKLEALGISVPLVRDSLRKTMIDYFKNLNNQEK